MMNLTNEQKYEYSKALLIELLKKDLITCFEFSDIIQDLKLLYLSNKAPKTK